jgi:alkylation response protein AidB-like acyl-CoA dehydrogenase
MLLIGEGTAEIQKMIIGRRLLGQCGSGNEVRSGQQHLF